MIHEEVNWELDVALLQHAISHPSAIPQAATSSRSRGSGRRPLMLLLSFWLGRSVPVYRSQSSRSFDGWFSRIARRWSPYMSEDPHPGPRSETKGMVLDAVHDDLGRTLGKDAVAYSIVTKYVRSAHFSGRKEAAPPEAPDVERSPVDEAILTAFAEFPFSSVCKLSRRICLPRSTVDWHLMQSLRFTARRLRWVPHVLTAEQNRSRFGS
jgi:hypothetical protein